MPEKHRVTRHAIRSFVTGYYILTVKKDTLTLDAYLAPYNGNDDTCPAPSQFFKLPTAVIPTEQ